MRILADAPVIFKASNNMELIIVEVSKYYQSYKL